MVKKKHPNQIKFEEYQKTQNEIKEQFTTVWLRYASLENQKYDELAFGMSSAPYIDKPEDYEFFRFIDDYLDPYARVEFRRPSAYSDTHNEYSGDRFVQINTYLLWDNTLDHMQIELDHLRTKNSPLREEAQRQRLEHLDDLEKEEIDDIRNRYKKLRDKVHVQ